MQNLKTECPLILDVGCGSGLSSTILQDGAYPWIGFDISMPMLFLGRKDGEPGYIGRTLAADMSRNLPLRTDIFDAAVSISVLQWICVEKYPEQAASTFFSNLYRSLVEGARAALQVYAEGDSQAMLLWQSSLHAGFNSLYVVDYPHSTPAKKFYLCLEKPITKLGKSLHSIRSVENPRKKSYSEESLLCHGKTCPLAWPQVVGTCSLSWIQYLKLTNERDNSYSKMIKGSKMPPKCSEVLLDDHFMHVSSRMQKEHKNLSRRATRLLRHATRRNHIIPPGEQQIDNNFFIEIEISAKNMVLMPCGGCLSIHLRISGALAPLVTGYTSRLGEAIFSCDEGWSIIEQEDKFTVNPMENICQSTSKCVSDTGGIISHIIEKEPTANFLEKTWTSCLRMDCTKKESRQQKAFFCLEKIPNCSNGAFLYANKIPPLLVFTADASISTDKSDDTNHCFHKTGVLLTKWQEVIARELLCHLSGCCIGLDLVINNNNLTSAWLMYIPSIEKHSKERLAAYIQKALSQTTGR